MFGGPQKTTLGGFKGFGLGLKAGTGSSATGPTPASRLGGLKPGGRGAARPPACSAFGNLDEDSSTSKANAGPSWAKPTTEALAAQRQAEELLAEDPSIFQYDEVLDDIKSERGQEGPQQVVRTDVVSQKKRTGLHVPEKTQVATGTVRQAKYIEKVIIATDRRRVEQQITEDKLLKKEKNARKDCEVFVTEAFKQELKNRQKFVEELEAQEERDTKNAAEKQEHGRGFADMYRNLLNGGLATSRGGEKVKEMAPARQDLKEEGSDSKPRITRLTEEEGAKEEPEEEVKEEEPMKEELLKDEVMKEEEDEKKPKGSEPDHGVVDAKPLTTDKKQQEQEAREEKALSAKERYLARKRKAAEEATTD